MVKRTPEEPAEFSDHVGWFDRFADSISNFAARSWFFFCCLLLVVIWAPSYFFVGDLDTWQLLINTPTTVITFLLVALIQNTQTRSDKALQGKGNALAHAVLKLLDASGHGESPEAEDLRASIGLEVRASSTEEP